MPSPDAILAQVFGFSEFRPGQREIVDAVTAGRNTLAIMPTGGGKSLCYQLPALIRPGVTLVISPLIALMRDQVRALREVGVVAGALTSGNTDDETQAVWTDLREGRLKLLYLAPERLSSFGVMDSLRAMDVSMIAVDEAHCVSQWGHDFRPDYLRIGELRRALDVPLAAFTATADIETRAEIAARLFDGATPETFLRGFDRPNLSLAFAAKSSPRNQVLNFVDARQGRSGIVYCGSRAKTEALAEALAQMGHSAVAYHAGLLPDARREVERRFQAEDGLIVVATVAFGMGVDKPDIRWVVHADLPKSIESYYQEIGRAGRDGAPAETLTLFGPEDIRMRRAQIDESPAQDARKAADHTRLNALLGLAEALGCRRQLLLRYFDDELPEGCGNCDTCARPPETFDGTTPVRMALSAVLRTGEYFGTGHLTDILLGVETDKVRARGHESLPTFGVGKAYDRRQWGAIFRQMMGHDLVRPDPSRHGALRMTEAARPVLRGEASVTLSKEAVSRAAKGPAVRALVSDEDAPLLSALKAKRRAMAQDAGLPAYMIFNDRTLIEMAERRPADLDAIARINGVGAAKLERYGAAFLAVITGDQPKEVHPARRALAGRAVGSLFDRLEAAQARLVRGPEGTAKYMVCGATVLRRIAERRPDDLEGLARVPGVGAARAERFGAAFLDEIAADGR